MEYCSTANVYQYAKLYHNKRPGVWTSSEDIRVIYNILSFLPGNLNLLKRTALRTEFEDVTTATPDLYSKICSNGNVPQHVILQQQQLHMLQLQQQHLETQQHRAQRNFLVQTEEQYIFLHDALVEAIASGETNLMAEQVEELKNCTPYLEQQYKNIIQFQPKDIHIASAMKQVNSIKNRGAIFPIEGSRVHLTPKPGEDGSDYINASWLHGFRRLRDFIVTQHPMAHTIKDFWQMVWDHNAQTVVLLSSLDDIVSITRLFFNL